MRELVVVLGLLVACGSPSEAEAPRPVPVPVQPPPPPPLPAPPAEPAPKASAPPATPAPVTRGNLTIERSIAAGKWPEGIVVVGDDAWVAESGTRRVAKLALAKDAPPVYATVGRLPVDMAAANGKIFTVAQTDKQLWEIDPASAKPRLVATLSDCPQAMTVADGAAWVLQWRQCSSSSATVARVDLATGKSSISADVGKNAFQLGHAAGRSWVTTEATVVTVADQDSKTVTPITLPLRPGAIAGARRIVASADGVYTSAERQVVFYDPRTNEVGGTADLGGRILALYADAEMVLAASDKGDIWILEPKTLAVRRELASATNLTPRSVARWGSKLLLVDHGAAESAGRVHVLGAP